MKARMTKIILMHQVGKEIKSEPQSTGRSLAQEKSRSTVRLEPCKERTTTVEKMIIPIKKDPLTKMTKGEVQKSTLALMPGRVQQREKCMKVFSDHYGWNISL